MFAASTRIANVVTWTTQNMKPNVDPLGNVARAICETTETLRARPRAHLHGEPRDADEERDRDHAEDGERARRVACLRMPERADAVRDRLDAREGG